MRQAGLHAPAKVLADERAKAFTPQFDINIDVLVPMTPALAADRLRRKDKVIDWLLTKFERIRTSQKPPPEASASRVPLGEAYCAGTLVLVRGIANAGQPFTAGIIMHPETDRVMAAAPILRFLVGQRSDHCRSYFRRMGWTATIVRNAATWPV